MAQTEQLNLTLYRESFLARLPQVLVPLQGNEERDIKVRRLQSRLSQVGHKTIGSGEVEERADRNSHYRRLYERNEQNWLHA